MISCLLHRPIVARIRSSNFTSTALLRLRHDKTNRVSIGDIDVPIGKPKVPYLVPSSYLADSPSSDVLLDLQWMMSKDILAQDMLLVGPPGAGALYRRRLALAYAELTNREVQVVTLSSDTTESDLKQRRELVQSKTSGSAEVIFVDQAPVEAAIEGRLLILDGLEKAERNVLPTLNNLLENREMHLEDGRFLVSPRRHEELIRDGLASDSFLVPVHEDFRVIALGVPSPPFEGRSLDPPLRSRFQIRRVHLPTTGDLYSHLQQQRDGVGEQESRLCAAVAGSMDLAASDFSSSRTMHFPSNTLSATAKLMKEFPAEDRQGLLLRAYPVGVQDERIKKIFGNKHESSRKAFNDSCQQLEVYASPAENSYRITDVEKQSSSSAKVTFTPLRARSFFGSDEDVSIVVPCGANELNAPSSTFVRTVGAETVLKSMVQDHAVGRDLLLLSPKGEGKNAVTKEFASLLGFDTSLFSMYKEMTSRDLFLRRGTNSETGETSWEESILVKAARLGELCVLDGVEKLRPDVLASLHSFVNDRDAFLPDGRRLIRDNPVPDGTSLESDDVVRVHPSFRIVALASATKEAGSTWLTEDVMSMFSSTIIPEVEEECLSTILQSIAPDCSEDHIEKVVLLRESLTDDIAADCGVVRLSTRDLIRIVKRLASTSLYDAVCSVLVAELLPPTQRSALDSLLAGANIKKRKDKNRQGADSLSVVVDDGTVGIGNFSMQRAKVARPEMVPSPPDFVDIPNHVHLIRDLLRDYVNGERAFLLLGNQGVGKNIVIDRMCQLAKFEREYIQLHRDSTIGQLTLSPSLEDGKIVWKDSPLVRAATEGCVLVIDEADKAPVEVISVLKALVEDGELSLADGRRISRHGAGPGIIEMHPDFALFVLANRPGFPFLGNDFFREIGDCFSTRVIPNPDLESEVTLLQAYAPDVEASTLRRIAAAFADLRKLCDHGDITYPYSTREAVAVAKHLSRFPNDDIVSILHNVLDFDSFDDRTYATLASVFAQHGMQIGGYHGAKRMARGEESLSIEYHGERSAEGKSANPPELSDPKFGKWDETNEAHVGGNQWAGGTGGSDTAGLGGRGGPYRLDRGHKVHQVSDEAKAQVSEEAARAARAIAEKALAERLNEINMTQSEWGMYNRFLDPIKSDVAILRGMLSSLDSKRSERGWLKRQNHGELDDSKLVDGITGDKFVYKRRGKREDYGPSQRPKRLRFVMDCSASMYRFNGYDERLFRSLEAALLVMMSFEGNEGRFDYSIVAHSGDSSCITLVDFGKPPENEKEYMKILQSMVAHTQYCQSGDHTLEALEQAVHDVVDETHGDSESSDDNVVVLVSDANLSRYGIHPRELGRVVRAGSEQPNSVKAYCIFIASFGEEADEINQALPLGRGHICMQTSDLPRVIRDLVANV
eukprot:CAMPEP_0119030820 /NCGR_PEP_ID=MMETSP1176-20130426/41225_1 /TAXON_ID=265551 /ORGANISM="Synedropsis recta cf, Strain CCMP1620" /LENGTH=1404 /DNA_ID=CAMNT_0006987197 /DNA_START=172 /DNA_END=4386 /DNA_ORIENTATION=+